MIKSMTGYGRAVETVNGRQFTVELRSVNNRYLDCSVKAPRMLSFGEEAVKQAVKNSISRGKVDVFITLHSENGLDATVTLNTAVVEGYLAAMEQMASSYPVKNDISVSLLSRMPEVFSVEKPVFLLITFATGRTFVGDAIRNFVVAIYPLFSAIISTYLFPALLSEPA